MKFIKLWAKIILVLFQISVVSAAPILVTDANGQLTGATGIEINGELFDVAFVDGSFVDIFGDASGLDATTPQEALAFSTALDEQVFNPANFEYDNDSGLTNGCTNNWRAYCYIYTPYADLVGVQLSVSYLLNRNFPAYPQPDSVGLTATNRNISTATYFPAGDYVYADWSHSLVLTGNNGTSGSSAGTLPVAGSNITGTVPVPSAMWLVGIGLVGLRFNRQQSRADER